VQDRGGGVEPLPEVDHGSGAGITGVDLARRRNDGHHNRIEKPRTL
jgi:hypothetical protein